MIELPRSKPGTSDSTADYVVKPIEAGDIDNIMAAWERQIRDGHVRGGGILNEDFRAGLQVMAEQGHVVAAGVARQAPAFFEIRAKSAFLKDVWVGFYLERTAFGRRAGDESRVTDFEIDPWYDSEAGPGATELHILAVAPELEDKGAGEKIMSRILDAFLSGV